MKTLNLKIMTAIIALSSLTIFSSCAKDEEDEPAGPQNIVEVASSNSDFSILVSAIVKADLVSVLQGSGPFTVFAPTNAAFNTLFTQLGVSGISALSAETLRPILLNHVIDGNVKAGSISTGYATTKNNNIKLFINKSGDVMVDESKVIQTDVTASNGVIHAIDKVILPPSIINHAINNPGFSILVEAIVKAGLVEALSADGPFTVFAPDNNAFTNLFAALGVSGIDDLTAEQLTPILLYHVVSGNILAAQVTSGEVPTLNTGNNITVLVNGMGVVLNGDSNVIATDVQGTNGVIHAIDKVLLP